ncbi:hypothetical protein CCHR01_04774 [Colletotrichum chrysophilum]|uniref:C2H2-type domain-containing protein n=1 Tax=Colletotrichum chrysophilum TaxID=1836956 RepID=A0AAD9ASG1_9PEZI|nr:hypothetical protein CCHR01_04774 [Colletotrichum chrysophilum]
MAEGIGRLQLDTLDEKSSENQEQEPCNENTASDIVVITGDDHIMPDATDSTAVFQNRSGRHQPRTTQVSSRGHAASTSDQRQPLRSNTEPSGITYQAEKRPPKRRNTEPNGDDPDHTRKKNKTSSNDAPSRFACPYFKHDRVKHLDCLHFQLSRVKDVKQHIFRKHQFHCPRCFEIFPDNMKCEKHIISGRECQLGEHSEEIAIRDSISEDQKKELSSRANSGRDETKQWFAVWDVLFKKEERPDSPLLGSEVAEMIEVVRELWAKNGADILSRRNANSAIDFGIGAMTAPLPPSCTTISNNMPPANIDATSVTHASQTMDSLLTELAHVSAPSQSTSANPNCLHNDESSCLGHNSRTDAVITVDTIQEDDADIFAEPPWNLFPQDPMVTDVEGTRPIMTPSADIWPIQTQGFEDHDLAHTYFEPTEQIAIDPTLTIGDLPPIFSEDYHLVTQVDLSFADATQYGNS